VNAGRNRNVASASSWLFICFFGLCPLQAVAQESIRVVESIQARTGERHRYVIRELETGEIRALQSALREAGYVGIGWTGRMDDGTVRGLRRFQRERGLVECGCVSYETVVALGLRPEVVATVAGDPGGNFGASTTRADSVGSRLQSGVLYPVAIPIHVPWPPPCDDDPCSGERPGAGGESPAPTSSDARTPARGGGGVASPPGIRPAPPGDARTPISGPPR
jgi:hypothetical protein